MNDVIKAKMVDGVLFVEATDYQLTLAKYEALSIKYDELRSNYNTILAENQALRLPDED